MLVSCWVLSGKNTHSLIYCITHICVNYIEAERDVVSIVFCYAVIYITIDIQISRSRRHWKLLEIIVLYFFHFGILPENVEDTKGVIRRGKYKTVDTVVKRKKTNNDIQNTAQKTKDWAIWTTLKSGEKLYP